VAGAGLSCLYGGADDYDHREEGEARGSQGSRTPPALLAARIAALHHRTHSVKSDERLEFAAPTAPFVGDVRELPLRPLRRLLRIDPFGERSPNLGRKLGKVQKEAQESRFVRISLAENRLGVSGLGHQKIVRAACTGKSPLRRRTAKDSVPGVKSINIGISLGERHDDHPA
jgi:hypothetical protein